MEIFAAQPSRVQKFWNRVDKSSDCWLWTGCTVSSTGYGKLMIEGKQKHAHRVAYELAHGPLAKGLVIDHMCHNRLCVKPDHLQQVTYGQNSQNRAGAMKNSQSGVRGVFPKRDRWRAVVTLNRRPIQLGVFETIAEAEACVIEGRRKYFTNSLMDQHA